MKKNLYVLLICVFGIVSACSEPVSESRLVVEEAGNSSYFGGGNATPGVPGSRGGQSTVSGSEEASDVIGGLEADEGDSPGEDATGEEVADSEQSRTPDGSPGDEIDSGVIGEDVTEVQDPSDAVNESESGDSGLSGDFDGGDENGDGSDSSDAEEDSDSDEEIESWTIDVSDVECLFVPDFGVFNPVLECYWDSSLESPKHDDVVMTPVVANLTDDDLDGDVDLQDIPDIAFISYRYQEDGCCNAPGVLRIISGRCNSGTASIGLTNSELDEHVTVDTFELDNSSGLAVGDVDNDGQMEIYALKRGSGSVLYSGIEYPQLTFSEVIASDEQWQIFGDNPATALSQNDGDATRIQTNVPGASVVGKGQLDEIPVAISDLRVRVTVRTDGSAAYLMTKLMLEGEGDPQFLVQETNPKLFASKDYVTLRFSFPRNLATGEERQWKPEDIEKLSFEVVNESAAGVDVFITEVALEAGSVFLEWESDFPLAEDLAKGAQASIVDVNQDGLAELLVGRVLIDSSTGLPIWTGDGGTGINGFIGPLSFAADVDQDGQQEVIAGDTLYSSEGEILWQVDYGSDGTGCKSGGLSCDGFNAVGNFDGDQEAEVVTVRNGVVYVFEHTGEQVAKRDIPGAGCSKNEGGPPTIADFDNDGEAEIGVAGSDYYVVMDWECCVDPLNCNEIPVGSEEECEEPGIRWKVANQDCSSRVTGSSVFDFQGDGAAEVVYNDEKLFRIFDGSTGSVLVEVENNSHTRLEYPVIVDSDRDGNAEIVFIENKDDATAIQVWGDSGDNWVPTRTIWNQHAYHISNINEDGTIPDPGQTPSWLSHNTFRQNLPEFDPFLAPDLQAEWVSINVDECPAALVLEGKVCNGGQLWSAGVDVRIYNGAGELLTCEGGIQLDKNLESGECTQVLCRIENPGTTITEGEALTLCVDGLDASCIGPGWSNECDETNNSSITSAVICP